MLFLLYCRLQSGRITSDMKIDTNHMCVTEFLHLEKIAVINIHWFLLSTYRDQSVNVSTIWWLIMFYQSQIQWLWEATFSPMLNTALNPQNKEWLKSLLLKVMTIWKKLVSVQQYYHAHCICCCFHEITYEA